MLKRDKKELTEENTKNKMWRAKCLPETYEFSNLTEAGYLPSDMLDNEAEDIIEEYNEIINSNTRSDNNIMR